MKTGVRTTLPSIPEMSGFILLTISVVLVLASPTAARTMTEANEENCEVCVKFLTKFISNLPSEAQSSPAKIEKELLKTCKTAKKAENRFCYYVGGTEDSATSTLNEITKPASWGMPAEKICLKLQKKDAQICDLKYDKSIDYVNMNLKKMRVKELKKVLSDWDDTCRGCTEKSDYIKRIEELLPKYAPEAAAARAAKSEL